jgi:spore coat protein U-like protein
MKKFSNTLKSVLPGVVLGVLALSLACIPAAASTATATFLVSTSVAATCTVSTTPLAFGSYTGVLSQATASGTFTCTNTTPYNVGLSAGLSTGATVTSRKMTGPAGALLAYSLFSDTGRTVNWGTTIGTDTVAMVATGLGQTLTVYGQIPAGQYFAPGTYSDTITVTVTY